MNKVYLKPKKEESLLRFHPWVFSGAIARVEGNPEEGEVVEVYTSDKQYIATGHYQIGSIAVRVLSFKKEEINHSYHRPLRPYGRHAGPFGRYAYLSS